MAQDTRSKVENQGTQPQETRSPQYEYQKDDARTFNVQFSNFANGEKTGEHKTGGHPAVECSLKVY